MEKLNAELKILRAELDKLEIQIGQYKNQQFNLESIKSFICSVREMIERGNLSFEDKRYIIEKLISEIRVDYTEGEDVVVSVIGVLDDIIQTEMKIENDIELSSQREKFENTGEDAEDLISIGTIGLIKAIESYSAGKGTKLATYAARCIENEILMHLRVLKKTKKMFHFMIRSGKIKRAMKYRLLIY